ncbi:MAG: PIG-L family deacetylase [Alphaproteobacteria bacterium]|nr:PIG-L family deacetylase [Alphaproteobacteria bacterium]
MANSLHIVCFGAHPDDCEIFAGGLMRAFVTNGARVTFVIATDGALSNGPPADPALAATRREEAKAAAAHIGAAVEMLGFPDGGLSLQPGAIEAVDDALLRYRPDLVVTHHERDYHRDHREISRLVRSRIGPVQRFLTMEPLYGVGALPDTLVDITPHAAAKRAAILEHRTQDGEAIVPQVATWNAFRAIQMARRGVEQAEGYVIPPDIYADPSGLLAKVARVRRL